MEIDSSPQVRDDPLRPEVRRTFTLSGFSDETQAYLFARNALPLTDATLPDRPLALLNVDQRNRGEQLWEIIATYGVGPAPDDQVQLDTTGETVHMERALSTTAYGTDPPNLHDAINWDGERIQGVDVPIPSLKIQITRTVPKATIDATIGDLATLTGTVNSATYLGRPAGELLFTGLIAQTKDAESYRVTYSWKASPNLTDLEIGGITGINKKGWEYLWAMTEKTIESNTIQGSTIVPTVRAVYVQKLFREADHNLLP